MNIILFYTIKIKGDKMEVKQVFTPALTIYKDGKEHKIKTRVWTISDNDIKEPILELQNMGEITSPQIEEIWKHYDKDIWISNLGYVAEITEDRAKKRLEDDKSLENFEVKFKGKSIEEILGAPPENFENNGLVVRELEKDQIDEKGYKYSLTKELIKVCNFVPKHNNTTSYFIDLFVEKPLLQKKTIYHMVADRFLEKPEGTGLHLHHIDNNSYNNSVTNLIWLKQEDHNKLHKMSYKA